MPTPAAAKWIISSPKTALLWNYIKLSRPSFASVLREAVYALLHAFKNSTINNDSTIVYNIEAHLAVLTSNVLRAHKYYSSLYTIKKEQTFLLILQTWLISIIFSQIFQQKLAYWNELYDYL